MFLAFIRTSMVRFSLRLRYRACSIPTSIEYLLIPQLYSPSSSSEPTCVFISFSLSKAPTLAPWQNHRLPSPRQRFTPKCPGSSAPVSSPVFPLCSGGWLTLRASLYRCTRRELATWVVTETTRNTSPLLAGYDIVSSPKQLKESDYATLTNVHDFAWTGCLQPACLPPSSLHNRSALRPFFSFPLYTPFAKTR